MPKPSSSSSRSVSRSGLRQRLAAIIILGVVALAVAYPPPANRLFDGINSALGTHIGHLSSGFVLGLDLQGGTRLEYEADVSQVSETERRGALDGVRDVIERRVNSLGVSEPLVQTAHVGDHWRVAVELAGIRDVNQAIKLIGETPILEFKEQSNEPPRSLTPEEQKKIDTDNAATKKRAEADIIAISKAPALLEQLAKASSTDAASQALGGDLGFIAAKPEYKEIFDATKDQKAGTLLPHAIETPSAYIVARVEESKAGETEIRASHIVIQYVGATGAGTSTTATKEEAKKRIDEIRAKINPANFAELAKTSSAEPGAKETGGDLGWFKKGAMVPEFEAPAFALKPGEISQVVETPFGYHIIYKTGERPTTDVRVRAMFYPRVQASDILPPASGWRATELTGKQLKRAQVEFDSRTGAPEVSLQFDDEGGKLFAGITKRNLGKPVGIFLDGDLISSPTVQSEITNGQAVITGNSSIEEVKVLAQRLQAGALPVPITLIAQQSVGPTLGQDSVGRSFKAGLFGFLFITLFMLFWYRAPGFFSILSLTLYVGLSFTIFKLLPVTLTLSGIAGFVLSLGIAVDANVLVYERLKEELRSGKTYRMALEEAFSRAWPSIRDGNTTTLIACAVLYWFSSSIIKGFALTLAIGIVLSLFTAIVVTRTVLRLVSGTRLPQMFPWWFLDSSSKKQ